MYGTHIKKGHPECEKEKIAMSRRVYLRRPPELDPPTLAPPAELVLRLTPTPAEPILPGAGEEKTPVLPDQAGEGAGLRLGAGAADCHV